MAVALPHSSDRGILLQYVRTLCDSSVSHLHVSDPEKRAVEEACDTVLNDLAALRLFFTNSPTALSDGAQPVGASDGREDDYVPDPGRSHFPSLTKTSITYVMAQREPRSFFHSLSAELEAAARALAAAKTALRALSQSRCCILTADVTRLKTFVQSVNRRGITRSLVTRVGMHDARHDVCTETAQPEAEPTSVGSQGADASDGEPSVTEKLLSIPDACIPSDAVKESYAAFLQGCTAVSGWVEDLLKWVNHVDDVPKAGTFQVEQPEPAAESSTTTSTVAEGVSTASAASAQPPKPRTRTVQVKRYEINDVWHIFGPLHEQAQLFFISDYTTYDARLQCRLLNPDYYVALAGLIDEIAYEVRHMEIRAAGMAVDYSALSPYGVFQHNGYSAQRNGSGGDGSATLVFRPPISAFRALRGELALYLSFCVYEDDLTSLVYYQRLYTNFVTNAQEIVRAVRELPKPPHTAPDPAPGAAAQPPATTNTDVPTHLMTNTFRELQVDHSDRTTITTTEPEAYGNWSQSPELRAILISRFESFVELRERVHYLKKGLENDIKQKNRTHNYLPAKAAVMKESTREVTQLELDLNALDQKLDTQKKGGLWDVAKASWQALADIATCKAEVDPYAGLRRLDATTADQVAPRKTSPLCAQKRLLLAQVQRLWKVVEIQASQLESTYPTLFDRGAKEKLLRRVNELIDKAASRSVVFDSS